MSGGRLLKRKTLADRVDEIVRRMEQVERRYEPKFGQYEIKVFADRDALDGNLPDSSVVVSAGDEKFIFAIPEELKGCRLINAQAFVSAVSTAGDIVVTIFNLTDSVDMLDDPITIDEGDFTSYASASPSSVDEANATVATGDRVAVNVDEAGEDAEGLGVILVFIEEL